MAKRIVALDSELVDNRKALDAAVADTVPELCELPGVGSVVAASVLTAWSHPGRVRSEAAFAALAGTCPIPASSGNTLRYRLNRGGDRRLNRALTTVVIVRMRTHAPTKAYVARRRAEGRTTKEIMRSLKRYITRQLYRTLAAAHPASPTGCWRRWPNGNRARWIRYIRCCLWTASTSRSGMVTSRTGRSIWRWR